MGASERWRAIGLPKRAALSSGLEKTLVASFRSRPMEMLEQWAGYDSFTLLLDRTKVNRNSDIILFWW